MKVFETVEKYDMLSGAEHVLCALSGGKDSVALTHFLAANAKKLNITVSAAHFSHGIRKNEAAPERELCERLCASLGITLYCGEADTPSYAEKNGLGLEEAARILRYGFLEKTAAGLKNAKIATAHHLYDNAETVIMNIIRGAGISGLAGIPPKRDGIIRPLIETSRKEIEEYIALNKLEYATDVTNFEPCCRRNEIRLGVLPQLEKIEPSAVENIGRLSSWARSRNEEIKEKAGRLFETAIIKDGEARTKTEAFSESDEETAARLAVLMHKAAGGVSMLSSKHIRAILDLCAGDSPSKEAHVPQIRVCREYGDIVFRRPEEKEVIGETPVAEGESVTVAGWQIALLPGEADCGFVFDKSKVSFPLTVRSRKEGDRIFLNGQNKSLKKLMIDKKIPKEKRDIIPVLCDNSRVIAVAGIGFDKRLAAQDKNKAATLRIGRTENEP